MFENFRDTNEALRGLRMNYWVDCGTLLGMIRDGDFIGHDTDIDFGVIGTEKSRRLTRWMTTLGFEAFRTYGTPEHGYEQRFRRNGVNVDVFYYYEQPGGFWSAAWWKKKHIIIHDYPDILLPTQPVDWLGVRTYIPAEPEALLECRYGSDWRTPNPEWRWYRDPKNIRPETRPHG